MHRFATLLLLAGIAFTVSACIIEEPGPGPGHARDLGATGGQADPGRVRPPGQRLGHHRRRVRRALHPDQPGRQSDQVRLDQPAHAQLPRGPEPVVPPGDGLIGHPEHLADQAERGPAVELQRVDELNIESVRHGISPSIPSPVSISAEYLLRLVARDRQNATC